MSEIITALRSIEMKASNECFSLAILDGLEDGVVTIADAVPVLEKHLAVADEADTHGAIKSARAAIDYARDRIATANAPRVVDADLMTLRGIRQGAELLRAAIEASFAYGPLYGQLVVDVDGVTTPVAARDVGVREMDGRELFVVGTRSWDLDDAIAVTNPNAAFEWPAMMTQSGSVVRVRPA